MLGRAANALVIVLALGSFACSHGDGLSDAYAEMTPTPLGREDVQCPPDTFIQDDIIELAEVSGKDQLDSPDSPREAVDAYFKDWPGSNVPLDNFERFGSKKPLAKVDGVLMELRVEGFRLAVVHVRRLGDGWAVEEATFCSSEL